MEQIIQTGTVSEVIRELDKRWYSQYLNLVPLLKKLRLLRALEAGYTIPDSEKGNIDNSETFDSVYSILFVEIDKIRNQLNSLFDEISAKFGHGDFDHNTHENLATVYGHSQIVHGDLQRYLDTYEMSETNNLRKSFEHYTGALSVCPNFGKAYSGLYIVSANLRPLLSIVYLIKSMRGPFPFNEKTSTLELIVKAIAGDRNKLVDVPVGARLCVSQCLELLVLEITGRGASREKTALVESIKLSVPLEDVEQVCFDDYLPVIDWDTLLIIALTDDTTEVQTIHLDQVMKLLVGRCLSLGRLVPIAAFLEIARGSHSNIVACVRAETAKRQANTTLAERALSMDHLMGVHFEDNAGESESEIAAARIAKTCATAPIVVLDAANLACRAGQARREADVQGILAAYKHYESRGFKVKVFVSERHAQRERNMRRLSSTKSGITMNLDEIFSLVPHSAIVSIPPQNYDDSYMIQYGLQVDAVIVSNDMYRDWSSKTTKPNLAEEWAKAHLISYTFVDDLFLPNPEFKMPQIPWPGIKNLVT